MYLCRGWIQSWIQRHALLTPMDASRWDGDAGANIIKKKICYVCVFEVELQPHLYRYGEREEVNNTKGN
jgi:hypothetical protein